MIPRAKPQALQLVGQASFGSHHVYQSAFPINDILSKEFWITVYGNVRPGDTVQLQQVIGDRLVQFADTIVVQSQRSGVELFLKGGVVDIAAEEKPTPVTEEDGDSVYEIIDHKNGWVSVQDNSNSEIVRENIRRKAAEQWITEQEAA